MKKSISIVVVLAAAACASHPPPTDRLANAIAAARAAQEAGAAQVPQAALQLKLAQEQIAQARAQMEDGENERAHYLALRASNDAELAVALARENSARKRAEEASGLAASAEAPKP